jgi:hypothetical protein
VKSNSVQSTEVTTASFEALKHLFDKLTGIEAIVLQGKEEDFTAKVTSLLYQPFYEAFGGDLRLKRAKAVASLSRIPSNVAVEKILKGRLEDEILSERSQDVKDELAKAKSVLG